MTTTTPIACRAAGRLRVRVRRCRCALAFLGLAALAFTIATTTPAATLIYVATDGNDRWSGHSAVPNRSRTDGPLATLTAARNLVRSQRSRFLPGEIRVCIKHGTYRLAEAFELTTEDSGSAESPVVYCAYPNETPVISGGRALGGFHQAGAFWKTEVPAVKDGGWYFHELFVNGARRTRARSPNSGYFRIAQLLPAPAWPNAKPFARDKFVFSPGDIQLWDRLQDADLVLMHSWENSIHPLRSVDVRSNVVEFAPLKEWWGLGYWEDHQRYFVENAIELLDEPGEWYLDRHTGELTYFPLPHERPDRAEIVAPMLTNLVRFAGDPDQHRFIQHITLRGLSFQHTDWQLDRAGASSTQAAVEVPATILADGALNCAVEFCDVSHIGNYAVWLRRGCKDCRVQHNRLHDLGAGGIRIGQEQAAAADMAETSRTWVDNNHIFDGGHVFPGGVGG